MDITFHANIVPWLMDPGYLLYLVEMGMVAVILLSLSGLAYAGLYYLLRYPGSRPVGSDQRSVSSETPVSSGDRLKYILASDEMMMGEFNHEA
jgi:hypothetical protein